MPAIHANVLELSPPHRLQLEAWLAEFGQAWDEDRLDAPVDRLPPPGHPLRRPALVELVKIDLERHWQRGRRIRLADYLARYPELGPADALPTDLLLAEQEARRQFGDEASTLLAPPANVEVRRHCQNGSRPPRREAPPACRATKCWGNSAGEGWGWCTRRGTCASTASSP